MSKPASLFLFALFLLSAGTAPGAAAPPTAPSDAGKGSQPEAARTIEMHKGVAGLAYIGQPLKDFLGKFPRARPIPFAKQEDAVIVKVPEAGISCMAVGPAGEMKVASVGFNWRAGYEGLAENAYRTSEGIGKGSTINDLLATYGRPTRISAERTNNPGAKGNPMPADPGAPQKYSYGNAGATVTTYFVVEGSDIARVVINHLAPLERHILKRPPAEAGPVPSPSPESVPPAAKTQP